MSKELAEQFLKSAEELIESKEAHERLIEVLDQAEKLFPEDVSILCRSARLLFRYGALNGKGRFYLLALDKLKLAEEKNPLFFETTTLWWQLWGNILIQLGKMLHDASFFEMALHKFQKAEKVTHEVNPELSWDTGEAWILLGQKSGEPIDYQKGLTYFYAARNLGVLSPFFRLDFACALSQYGQLIGDPALLEESISFLRSVLSDVYHPEKEPSVAYIIAWRKLALAMKIRFLLSHQKEHFEEAEATFRDAILAATKNGELWLDWGELYLQAGWLKRDFKLVETALEKLTSAKVKECDPIRASFLLGMGLVIFGLFLENLKLIKDGQARILAAQEADPQNPQLQFASVFSEMSLGLYFSDATAYAHAVTFYESVLQENAFSTDHLYALFQAYMAWGLQLADLSLLHKAIEAITRLCQLRPFSHIHLNEWGVALLRLKKIDVIQENYQAYVEEAIDKFQKAAQLCDEEEILYNWGCALDLLGDLTADEEDYARAIDLLTKAFEKRPSETHIRYHLGLAFSHLGELTSNADCLMQAADLLESVSRIDQEDENIFCELGYALLNLSELIFDPLYPEEGEKKRRDAERALIRAAELGSGDACYHLACLYSLSSLYEPSLHYLKKAEEVGRLPIKEDLEHDEWLEGLRSTEAFQDFFKTQE